jgi:hypothetical protein
MTQTAPPWYRGRSLATTTDRWSTADGVERVAAGGRGARTRPGWDGSSAPTQAFRGAQRLAIVCGSENVVSLRCSRARAW